MKKFLRFLKDKSGVTAIEYGLIAGFLSLALVEGATIAAPALENVWDELGDGVVAADDAN